MYREWKEIEFPKEFYKRVSQKKILNILRFSFDSPSCMDLGTTRLERRPTDKWQDGVREDGRIVNGEGWKEKVHNREEWKKLLRMARNRSILYTPVE